jgi:hypothetical protein
MTELEQGALRAFDDLVRRSGQILTVGTGSVRGLVNLIEPENAQHTLESDEGQDAIVKVKRSDWPNGLERKGVNFDMGNDLNFRIKSARKDTLFWIFRCKVY